VVIVEAAAYGLGVIGSDIGAIPEFVEHEKTGFLFTAGDPQELANYIIRAVKDQEILPNLAKNTKQILATASIENMVESYQREYQTLRAKI
jgi:glycosyltransferase involved in cell wall biosynthesis